jgi:hypothetical protein
MPRQSAATKSTAKTSAPKYPTIERVQPSLSQTPLPSSWATARRASELLWRQREFFIGLTVVYLLLDLLFVQSLAQFDISKIKDALNMPDSRHPNIISQTVGVYSSLFTKAATGSNDAAGAYHFFIITLIGLTTIYALRHIFSAKKKRVEPLDLKHSIYRSTAQLVPFLIVMGIMALQLLPAIAGFYLYMLMTSGDILIPGAEENLAIIFLIVISILTAFWIARTVIALYIATLPDMQPVDAYRKAKELVRGRRFAVGRKVLALPFGLFAIAAIVVVPCILLWGPLAQWVFFVLTGIGLIGTHAYLYTLYRELLGE